MDNIPNRMRRVSPYLYEPLLPKYILDFVDMLHAEYVAQLNFIESLLRQIAYERDITFAINVSTVMNNTRRIIHMFHDRNVRNVYTLIQQSMDYTPRYTFDISIRTQNEDVFIQLDDYITQQRDVIEYKFNDTFYFKPIPDLDGYSIQHTVSLDFGYPAASSSSSSEYESYSDY